MPLSSDGEELSITSDTDIKHLRERIGVGPNEKLRTSSRRENYLQKFSRVMTGTGILLNLHPSRADTDFGTSPPTIRIPGPKEDFPQPLTDIPQRVYEMIVQETVSLHEIGHVLYTDWGAFEEKISGVSTEFRPMFKDVFNAVEDGAIEAQLRGEFSCKDELLIMNANFSSEAVFGTKINPESTQYTFHEACKAAMSDMAIYDSGTLDKILSESNSRHTLAGASDDRKKFIDFLPTIEQFVIDTLSEPRGAERVEILWEFWQIYRDKIEEVEVGGIQSAQNKSGEYIFYGKSSGAPDGRELRQMDGEDKDASREANRLPSPEELRDAISGGDEEGDGDEEDEGPGSVVGDIDDTEQSEEELREKYQDEVRREAQEESGQMLDEAEEYKELLAEEGGDGSSGGELSDLEIGIPNNDKLYDPSRWQDVKRRSNLIEDALRRRLRRELRKRVKKNKRRGSLDTKSMIDAVRGSPRIFKKEERGEEKEYSCMVVMDRSGSMSGSNIEIAESSSVALLWALQNLGVDVSLMDMHSNTPRIALPLGGEVQQFKEKLFTEESSGGTPLSEAIELAHMRLEREADKFPFMIVVTDGQPNDSERYKEAIGNINFPVIGVNINRSGRSDLTNAEEFFHRQVEVKSESELYMKLRQLCEEVMM